MKIGKYEIESFMTDKLSLSGNELVLFAVLWKLSAKGEKEVAVDYVALSAAINTTIPTLYNCIRKLTERGYVEQAVKGQLRVIVKVS